MHGGAVIGAPCPLAAGMATVPVGHELAALMLLAILAPLHRVCSHFAPTEALDYRVLEPGREQFLDFVQQRSLVRSDE